MGRGYRGRRSFQDRLAVAIIEDAEKKGELKRETQGISTWGSPAGNHHPGIPGPP